MFLSFTAFVVIVLYSVALVREALRPVPASALYLRRCRESARFTRARAARIAGVDVRRIRELETGAPESKRGECWRIGHDLRRWTDDQAARTVAT